MGVGQLGTHIVRHIRSVVTALEYTCNESVISSLDLLLREVAMKDINTNHCESPHSDSRVLTSIQETDDRMSGKSSVHDHSTASPVQSISGFARLHSVSAVRNKWQIQLVVEGVAMKGCNTNHHES